MNITYQGLGWKRLIFSEYFQKAEQGKYILIQPKYWGCKKPLHDQKTSIKVMKAQFEIQVKLFCTKTEIGPESSMKSVYGWVGLSCLLQTIIIYIVLSEG